MNGNITVYPNPGNGAFQIQIDNERWETGHLEIYNVFGDKIYEQKIILEKNGQRESIPWRTEINLSDQPNGIYFVNIKTVDGVETKILINN